MNIARSLLIAAIVLFCCGTLWAGSRDSAKLHVLDHVSSDPLLVMATGGTSLDEVYDDWMSLIARFGSDEDRISAEAELTELEQQLGCSVRNDLLAQVGPEYALVLDLPPIDQLMGAVAGGPGAIGRTLTNLGIVAMVNEPGLLDACLRKLLERGEVSTSEEDGLVRAEFGSEGEGVFAVYYGFEGDVFAVGVSPEFVRASLKPRSKGQRLANGEDFAKVFKHLDRNATSVTYVNLPKAREMVKASAVLQALIDKNPDTSKFVNALMAPEFTGTGIGSTSVKVEGGTRTTNFASSELSGSFGGMAAVGIIAAIAAPNFLNAVDRGKQKRTMADIRSAGAAFEEYAIDNNVYPGPTEGWVPLEQLAESLSPVYIRQLPGVDGWGHTLLVWSDGEHYRIVSPGKDGELDRDWDGEIADGGARSTFVSDIVFGDGAFLVWPEGTQR